MEKAITTLPQKQVRILRGEVVSDAMQKTIVVRVQRTYKHPLVGKIVRCSKKYKAHDEDSSARKGDIVDIKECRPLSKDKHMTLHQVVKRAA